jgi:ribosomal protein L12E/L44/L45/RPP1/RPP2
MRNVWNDTEVSTSRKGSDRDETHSRTIRADKQVPEVYFDRVVAYLKTLPGSARKVIPLLPLHDVANSKGMIETAKKHATAIAKPEPKPEGQSEAEADVGGDEKEEEGEKEEGEGEKEAGSGGEVAVEMRRDRAQRILKALGAR